MFGAFRVGLRSGWPILLALMLACTRPTDRPLEGARPLRPGEAGARESGVPPTLAPPSVTATPLPPVAVIASPKPSPTAIGRNPILSGLLPAPSAVVPPGTVNIGARISGSSELTTVSLILNRQPIQPQVTEQDPRIWLVAYSGRLDEGQHEVRVSASDRDGRAGGYTWRFEVRPRPQLSPVPRAQPTVRP